MDTYKLSPYEYIPGSLLCAESLPSTEHISKEQVCKFFKDEVYLKIEFSLLESLYRFPYLTKKNMERYTNAKLKDRQHAGYDHFIRQLMTDGCLRRFSYNGTRLYCLSDGARAYFQDKLDPKNLHRIHIPSEENPVAVLECAALAQWHLSVMQGGDIRRSRFHEQVTIRRQDVFLPSFLEVQKNNIRYRVLSLSIPKESIHMEPFIDQILQIKTFLSRWGFSLQMEIFLIVLVCESTHEMSKMAQILEKLQTTKALSFYFVCESNTIFSKGLDLLYTAKRKDGEMVLETISVKG